MLDTTALSPEVKKLFADIAKQADGYKKAFQKLDSAIQQLNQDKEEHDTQLDQIKDDISQSIEKLETYANQSVNEFRKKTETTHKLFTELDKIDKLKTDLYDLKEEIKTQTIDLSNSLVDFNSKADKQLEGTISHIKTKLNNTIDDEVSKIENRVIRRLSAFEKNQKIFEKRILTIDSNSRAEIKKLAGEIDYVYNSITEIKSDIQNYFKQIIERIQHYDNELPRMSKLLDNTIAKMHHELGTPSSRPSYNQSEENFDAYDGDKNEDGEEEEYDDSLFDFDNTPFGAVDDDTPKKAKLSDRELMEKISEEYEEFETAIQNRKGLNTFSIILSSLSLAFVLIYIIINIIN